MSSSNSVDEQIRRWMLTLARDEAFAEALGDIIPAAAASPFTVGNIKFYARNGSTGLACTAAVEWDALYALLFT